MMLLPTASFLFNHPALPGFYPLSLHDALPICHGFREHRGDVLAALVSHFAQARIRVGIDIQRAADDVHGQEDSRRGRRSEEHTSELQSHSDLVCRLLLEKNKLARRVKCAK